MAAKKEDNDKQQDDGKGKKGGSKLKLIIIVVVLLVVLAGAFVAFKMFFTAPPAPPAESVAPAPANGAAAAPGAGGMKLGPLVAFDPFVVNLADPGGARYLKMTMSVELASEDPVLAAELETRKPQIKDIILTVLSSKSFEEVSTPQGKISLKQEIMQKLNGAVSTGNAISNVYITEFVVQ